MTGTEPAFWTTRRDDGETVYHYNDTDDTGQPRAWQTISLEALDIYLDSDGDVTVLAMGTAGVLYEIRDGAPELLHSLIREPRLRRWIRQHRPAPSSMPDSQGDLHGEPRASAVEDLELVRGVCYVCGCPAGMDVPVGTPKQNVFCWACFEKALDDYQSEG